MVSFIGGENRRDASHSNPLRPIYQYSDYQKHSSEHFNKYKHLMNVFFCNENQNIFRKTKLEKLINYLKIISQKSDITVYVSMTYNNNSSVKRLVLRP